MSVLDLFCGCGGLSRGFENAGFKICAGIDNNESFIKTFAESHNNAEAILEDLNDTDIEELLFNKGLIPKINVVIGGPPCQGFSTVGNRILEDPRNKLLKEFYKAVKVIEPSSFLMENVTGLTSMKNDEDEYLTEKLKELFEDIEYNVKHKIINSVNFGVPQKRKRFFMVGVKSDEFLWPQGEDKEYVTVRDAISDLPSLQAGGNKENYKCNPRNDYQKRLRKNSDTLTNHACPNHSKKVVNRISYIPPGGNHSDLPKNLQISGGYSNIYGRLEWDKPAQTITGNFGCPSAPGRFIHPQDDRALSVREGARLQSFSDCITFYGNRRERYKQVGNAVPPLLAEALANSVSKSI